jgi:hypothetical protein
MMKVASAYDEHEAKCDGKLKTFILSNIQYIHVELYCDKCESRYIADVYQMEEV